MTNVTNLFSRSGQESLQPGLMRQRRQLVGAVQKAAEDNESFSQPQDVIYPAQQIDKLIADARASKKGARHIDGALARMNRKVHHIERLRVDHELSHNEAKRITRILIKKIQPYFFVLEALADILQLDREDVLYDAFRDTSLNEPGRIAKDDPVTQLKHMIFDMVKGVIRVTELSHDFDKARECFGNYDLVSRTFLRSRYKALGPAYISEDERGWGYEGGAAVVWGMDRPAFPGIGLLRIERGRFSGPLLVEQKIIAPNKCSVVEAARLVSPVVFASNETAPLSLGKSDVVPAEVRIFTDIRLVIGPRTCANDFGPLFEIRSFVELRTHGKSHALTFPYSLAPLRASADDSEISELVGSVAAQFENGWRRVSGAGWNGWTGSEEINEYVGFTLDNGPCFKPLLGKDSSHEFAVYWQPVNVSTLTQLKDVAGSINDHRNGSLDSVQTLFDTDGPYPGRTEFQFDGKIMQDLEAALQTGGIERYLINECNHLKAALAERINHANETCDREIATMHERWHNLGRPK